mmetsp:Transcript_30210/g.39814  ORF Transcript_30210/g.39814 Transcript_30210/m.39814 type:complete len:420 (-) Transcript_30210:151-1410(-)|eukprot:CAMPEP_0117755502 /NCGR_PEP_ID=MMETSP0947-20121206/13494_1 /TAXON_ID=44440 /ORGANISM="Chattonella subsalsa, Strain CCMP2191" /LENGTH=419 /DNA_ID=CAMNT_0005574857 /DNA_START=77 /DNA_END=1336 /DNA_ORIENTATION=+
MALEELLGASLAKKVGGTVESIDTSAALDGKVVGLYFSAHWCPPCRGFTPKLAELYDTYLNNGKNFEIVFISSDKTQEAFDDYFKEMPWLALPFEDRDRKSALSTKFKVRGIPSLIILDEDSSVITTDGRGSVMADPNGEQFPWRPKPFPELLGNEFQGKDTTHNKSVLEGKNLGIYFSAHWCPPCRMFTPKLVSVYNKIKEQRDDFEVIFVSGDSDQKQFDEYFAEMPWLAIPYGDSRIQALNRHFEVNGIPCFVMVDAEGKVINKSARDKVDGDIEGQKFPWHPEPLEDLSKTAECMGYDINEKPALVIFMEGCDDHEQDTIQDILEPIAREYADRGKSEGDQKLLFFTANSESRITSQVRRLCALPAQEEKSTMVVLDIPDNGGFYVSETTDITEDAVRKFISKYKEGEKRQLSRG